MNNIKHPCLVAETRVTDKQLERPKYFECAGLKWMRTNLGANTETDYGLYYPWGGTIGYNDASVCKFSESDPLSNMLYCKSESELKAMDAIDDDGNLSPEYDAVTQAIGDGWRIPTIDELLSLLDNTDYTLETNFKGSGVNGGKFTLKDGSDYLFIPISGDVCDGSVDNADCYSYVWSSTACLFGGLYANSLYFGNDYLINIGSVRHGGLSVRGVKAM